MIMNKKRLFEVIYKKAGKSFARKGILSRYPFLRPLRNFVVSQIKSDVVLVGDYKMYIDSKDSLGLSIHGSYESFETELVKKIVKKGNIVLDIGANIGYYTLVFSKLVDVEGKVFAFEPELENFRLLEKNVLLNKYSNVILENVALSNKNGTAKLYLSEERNGMHRIYPSHFCQEKYLEVDMISLDDYFKNKTLNKEISFIKIDVEGSEFGVLQGMKNLLEKNKHLKILIEFNPSGIKEFGANPKDVLNLLQQYGFKIYIVDTRKNELVLIEDMEDLIKKYDGKISDKNPRMTNLLCSKDLLSYSLIKNN